MISLANGFQSEKQKKVSYIVFGMYLVLLIWLVLFKFATNISEIPSMRSINFIPFNAHQETLIQKKEILYNILAFVPFGVFVQIFKVEWNMAAKWFAIMGISFLFEVIQFIFAIGASDITDLIGNTMGGIIGVFFCVIMQKVAPKKFIKLVNVSGLLIESIAMGLLLVLLVAN